MWDVLTNFNRDSDSVASRIAANEKDAEARKVAIAASAAASQLGVAVVAAT